MLNGLYSAGSAMDAAARQHELISRNLANAQMSGYRRQMMGSAPGNFNQEMQQAMSESSSGNASLVATDFSQGALERTEHPLDLALQGDGFFVVEGPDGPLYTRNGSFQLTASGQLVTGDQLPVMGTGGAITIPPTAPFSSIQISKDGAIYAAGNQVGQIDVVDFEDRQKLQLRGNTLFAAPADAAPDSIATPILQGVRERSNVSPVLELVDLINVQRKQEAAQRSMSALSESISRHVSTQGGI